MSLSVRQQIASLTRKVNNLCCKMQQLLENSGGSTVENPLVLTGTWQHNGAGVVPTFTMNKNTTLATLVEVTYISAGDYEVRITMPPPSTDLATMPNVQIFFGNFLYEAFGGSVYANGVGYSGGKLGFHLVTKVNTSTFADMLLLSTPMKIEIYPQ